MLTVLRKDTALEVICTMRATDLYEVDEAGEVVVLGPERPLLRRLDALLLRRVQDPHEAPSLGVAWN